MLIINIGLLVATAGAAAIAWWQAIAASRERGKAEDAAQRALVAQETAAEALARSAAAQEAIAAVATQRPPWSGPRRVKGDIRALMNSSGRRIIVERVVTKPPDGDRYLHVVDALPCTINAGEEFQYAPLTAGWGAPKGMTLIWRFDGGSEENTTLVPF